jgi:hypothetical protein
MKRIAAITITSLILSGCSVLPFHGFTPSPKEGLRNKLDTASSALAKGKTHEADTLLHEIIAHSSVAGVTDEAIFRLALLRLSGDEDNTDNDASRLLLTRLQKEFPHSQWTTLSRPVVGLLDGMKELDNENQRLNGARYRELQNIKGLNQSLIRQNRGLQQTLDRLKAMDLELERKSR